MYSQEQIDTALEIYHQCGSATKTVRMLGYPERETLYMWIRNEGKQKPPRKELPNINTPEHPRNPSYDVKMNAIHRCFELGETIKSVSEEIGYSRASIYAWRRKYLKGGGIALMNDKNIKPGSLTEGQSMSDMQVRQILSRMDDMQMEIDILKETINVLKKDRGINTAALKNREKAVIVDALKDKHSLPVLLEKLDMPRSSYYYQEALLKKQDKYSGIRKTITQIFLDNQKRYGYRRIHAILKRNGITVSEKVVRRIMREENLTVKIKRTGKYNSYKGEISPSVPNVIERDFHADRPNEKWLTDITEFGLPSGKVYLSAIVDCFDGMLPCWTIGVSPDAELVNSMLDKAVEGLKGTEMPVIHSDRGCHYRWTGWISRMEKAGLTRSMSRKGCSPDNAACEGLFGRLKNEMFYNRDWTGVNLDEFIETLNEYLIWYNEKRIKVSLGNMSPLEYRQSLGLSL